MIVKCMNDGMGSITDWVGRVNGTENIIIDISANFATRLSGRLPRKSVPNGGSRGQPSISASVRHGGRWNSAITKGLLSVDPGTANNVKFYTRLYPVGAPEHRPGEIRFYSASVPGGQSMSKSMLTNMDVSIISSSLPLRIFTQGVSVLSAVSAA